MALSAGLVFVDQLCRRLQRAMPEGFKLIRGVAYDVEIVVPGCPSAFADVSAQVDRGDFHEAAWNLMSYAQDQVAEHSGQPWPGTGTRMPMPDARWTVGGVHCSYRVGEEIVVELGTIPIDAPFKAG